MRRLSSEERRRQIIDAAIGIIHEHGYPALAMRELSRRVGISEPAIYRHFASKEDIVIGILDRVAGMNRALCTELEQLPSVAEQLRAFIRYHYSFLVRHREITSVVFSESIFQPHSVLQDKMRETLAARWELLRKLVERGQQEGVIVSVDSDDLTTMILGSIRLLVLQWRLADYGFDMEQRGERSLRTLEHLIIGQKGVS